MTEPTRTLVKDDGGARRYQPQRWDWGRATKIRPWRWIMLRRLDAPKALAINAALFCVLLLAAISTSGSNTAAIWAAIAGIALPFSLVRAWHWWRIRHPPPDSWRPAGADEATPD
jgi:hypothetical protein